MSWRRLRRFALPVTVVVAGGLLSAASAVTSASPSSCANPVACENQLPGTPQSVWDVGSGEGTTIEGFADPFSVPVGGSINFKIKTSASSYKVDIYRMGYYGGDGARLVDSVTPNVTVSRGQPACTTNTVTGLTDCGNWAVSAAWNVPATAVSGVYFAHIYSSSDENQIPFVVSDPASSSKVVYMTSDETWQAYNSWGGNSVYVGDATGSPWCCSNLDPGRAVQVSYNRPFNTRFTVPGGQDFFFATEFPTVEFMEQNGYDVSYVSQSDVAGPGAASMLEQHQVFMNAGHSEYWDAGDVANVTAARNAGLNLTFFAGNLMWWKTRWASSQYGSEPYRTLITYKESLDSTQSDPADPPTWTGEWRDPRFLSSGDDAGQPENQVTGQLWMVNCCSYAETVSSAYSQLAIWKNTRVASLASGQTYTMSQETLGYEWDSDTDNGFRPPGEIDMSKTCENNVAQVLADPREDLISGTACNSLTLYRAASGALVFDTGTVQWAWGLNANHDGDSEPADPVIQQATVNLLAMMGVQPATLMSGLVAATAPGDTAPPTSAIASPAAGATFTNGATVTVTGTASDSGGGVVAGVEVSTNGGSTWHPVTSMSPASTSVTWSYTWSAAGNGPVTIKSRATDDDGNIQTPAPGVTVTVNCTCGLFGNNYVPSLTSADDTTSYELGVKFSSSVPGWVAGVRFYKGTGNNGTHTGSLWTTSGTLLATGTFTSETASGWQSMLFPNPVEINANTTYVVSYWDPDGHYAEETDLFDWPRSTPPLSAPQASYLSASGGNGVFDAGGAGFPNATFNGTNYGVDVIFDTTEPPGAPPTLTTVTPYPASTSNAVTTDPAATFAAPVEPGTTTFTMTGPGGSSVAGTVSLNTTGTVATFTPSSQLAAATTYTVTVAGATDQWGQKLVPFTYTFTTSQSFPPGCPCTVWPDTQPATAGDASDKDPVELGVKFTPTLNGTISAVRFYKFADNTGTHTGTLWSPAGTELATGTFSNESSQGWQQLNFAAPVHVTAGTTYVASYHTSSGHYAVTGQGLPSAVTSGPLTVPANGGVYAYGASTIFPNSSYNSSNYWVDVVLTNPVEPPPTVIATTPGTGATSVPTGTPVTISLSQQVQPGSATVSVTGPSAGTVAGTTTLDTAGTTLTFTPSSQFSAGTKYTVTVSGATNLFGTSMSGPYTWSFTTAGVGACPCSIFESDSVPAVASASDFNSVNLGVQFTPAANGYITGIKFYKGAGNAGTHVGSLWSSSGTLLGQVTFTNETASGWQQATFSSPVAVTAGTTYVASYLAPNGGYAVDAGGFDSAVTNPPLTAPANGGVFTYSGTSAFPSSAYNGSNYWVDVVFATQP